MTISSEEVRRLRSVKAAHERELMRKANVVGVGIGMRLRHGQTTGEPAIVVSVTRKVPRSQLAEEDVIPSDLDGVPVDVQATGELRAQVERMRQVKQARARELLRKSNVVGVGLGYKESRGVVTGELALVVSVSRKVHASVLAAEDVVPKSVDGIRTDVQETGVLRALELGPRDRWRPVVPPGVSLGHFRGATGTFGCLVHRNGEPYILSNNHVLADQNQGQPGDAIFQPGPADDGTGEDLLATLADYVPIDFGSAPAECSVAQWSARALNTLAAAVGSRHRLQALQETAGTNTVDAALAHPLSSETVTSEILYIGQPVGAGVATLGTEVQKTGRTTGLTQGFVTQIEATVRIEYRGQSATFSGQFLTSPMSQPGDSGSAVLDMDRQVVGLLFAGSDAVTVVNPIGAVLSALNVELVL